MNNKTINTLNTNEKIQKENLIKKRKKLKYTKTSLLIIFIILLLLLILGIKTLFNKNDKNNQKNENQEETKQPEETSKYTKEEKEKLEKLDYINEKINYFKWENIDRYLSYKENNKNLSNEKIVLYVNIGIDNSFYTNTQISPNQEDNTILVNKFYYIDSNFTPSNLTNINSKYQVGGKQLTKEATEAFNKMAQDAKEEGYTIRAVSTYRSFSYQKNLYNNYVKKDGVEKADTYSARAGFSEHQTGLAVDVDNVNLNYTKFGQTKEFEWMKENAHKYGYILRYTIENEFITGYKNEPWHYRYVGIDVATQMKNENISSYEEYYFMYLDK